MDMRSARELLESNKAATALLYFSGPVTFVVGSMKLHCSSKTSFVNFPVM